MADEPANQVLAHLKRIQADISDLQASVGELREGQLSLRDDVHAIRGDLLRHEHILTSLDNWLRRVETRLELVDQAE